MCVESQNECGCCADVHFGALLNQTARVIRRALDARISGVNPDLSGVRGMVLGDIVRGNRSGRDVYQRDIEQWFNIRRSSVTAMLLARQRPASIALRAARAILSEAPALRRGELRECRHSDFGQGLERDIVSGPATDRQTSHAASHKPGHEATLGREQACDSRRQFLDCAIDDNQRIASLPTLAGEL